MQGCLWVFWRFSHLNGFWLLWNHREVCRSPPISSSGPPRRYLRMPINFPWVQQHTSSHHTIVQNCISYWGNKSKFHFLLKSCSWYNYMLLLLCWWRLFFVIDTMSMSTMTLWVQLLRSFLLLNFWWATTITFWLSLMTDQSYHDSVTVCIELKTKFTKSKRCECDNACNNLTPRKHR